MKKRTHSKIFRKRAKNLKGFLKDDTIKKYMDINKKQIIKRYKFDLSYLMKIFLGFSLFFFVDYFYNLFYNKDNV